MIDVGLQKGDEVYVSVRVNKSLVADLVISVFSKTELSVELYTDSDADVVIVHEALLASIGAVGYRLERPHLKELLMKRVQQLKREDEEEEENNPPPPSISDMPF